MRLPHLTSAVRIHAGENNATQFVSSRDGRQLSAHLGGVEPQGCCGAKVCLPLVGCHCSGIESPLCP